jgi:nitroreductase
MVREYQQDRQIPADIINKLLRNAHRSPSAGHTQVQEFIVVIDPITKRKLCQASLGQSQVENASVLIIVCSNTSVDIIGSVFLGSKQNELCRVLIWSQGLNNYQVLI